MQTVESYTLERLRGKGGTDSFTDSVYGFFLEGNHHPQVTVELVSMHDGNQSIVESIFCHAMPASLGMCPLVQNATSKDSNIAPTFLWYDMLSTEAYRQGLIPNKAARRAGVFRAIAQHQESKGLAATDFPQVCPSPEFLDQVLQESLRRESFLGVPPPHSNSSHHTTNNNLLEGQHRQAFAEKKHKFCSIDTAAALLEDSQEWATFLQTAFAA